MYFDGDGDYIEISNSDLDLSDTNLITMSAWINPVAYVDSVSGFAAEIFRYGASGTDVLDLRLSPSGNLYMEIGSHSDGTFSTLTSTNTITLNKWTHVTGTFDGNTGEAKLYINAVENIEETLDTLTSFIPSTINIGIGNQVGASESFNGQIDEVVVYKKVLNEQEVTDLYSERKAVYADYTQDAIFGTALEFDGVDDYVNITSDIFETSRNNFTILLWLKQEDSNNGPAIFQIDHTGSDNLIFIGANSTSVIFNSRHTSGDSLVNQRVNVPFNDYYAIFAIFNGSHKSLYLNSELINRTIIEDPLEISSASIFLGADNDAGIVSQHYKGLIDEVKIFNWSLSQNEIDTNYFNYESSAKGCCNYLTLINPNKMGFNTSVPYNSLNISYSSKVFLDNISRGISRPQMNVLNLTNITSTDSDSDYTNFLVDFCMMEAYNIGRYRERNFEPRVVGFDIECRDLVEAGFY